MQNEAVLADGSDEVLANFHDQVQNCGFKHWDLHGYSAQINQLKQFLNGAVKTGVENADSVLNLVARFEKIRGNEETSACYDELDLEYKKLNCEMVMEDIFARYDDIIDHVYFG